MPVSQMLNCFISVQTVTRSTDTMTEQTWAPDICPMSTHFQETISCILINMNQIINPIVLIHAPKGSFLSAAVALIINFSKCQSEVWKFVWAKFWLNSVKIMFGFEAPYYQWWVAIFCSLIAVEVVAWMTNVLCQHLPGCHHLLAPLTLPLTTSPH